MAARKPLEFSPSARHEYLAELEYIARDSTQAAELVFSRVERTLDLIEASPELGTPGAVAGTRDWPVNSTSLTIVYRIRKDKISVLRIRHQRRKYP